MIVRYSDDNIILSPSPPSIKHTRSYCIGISFQRTKILWISRSLDRHFPKPHPKINNHRDHTGGHFGWGSCMTLHIPVRNLCVKYGFVKPPRTHTVAKKAQTLFPTDSFVNMLTSYLWIVKKYVLQCCFLRSVRRVYNMFLWTLRNVIDQLQKYEITKEISLCFI